MKRNTVQRGIILDTLIKLNNRPTIDEIYTELHKEHPSIRKSTVYRNLRQLAKGDIVRQVSLPDALERYDQFMNQHFRCQSCGSVFDVDIEYLSGINDAVQNKYGVLADKHDVIFSGSCLEWNKSTK